MPFHSLKLWHNFLPKRKKKRNLDDFVFRLFSPIENCWHVVNGKHTQSLHLNLILFYLSWLNLKWLACITSSQFLSTQKGFFLVTTNWTFSKAIYITNAIAFEFAQSFAALNFHCNLCWEKRRRKNNKLLLNWLQLSFWDDSRSM